MMGFEKPKQGQLFYTNFNLDTRVRSDHPLRKIAEKIDFDFSYEIVAHTYGNNGNESIPPPVLLKLMFLLIFYNVRSERELMLTLPERLDWLLFLGYDIDSPIPNHSVLSKARSRWGTELFKSFFERIVFQCVESGLVDGKKIFMDSSFIDANASRNSIIDKTSLKTLLNKKYQQLERRLDEIHEKESERHYREKNNRYVSLTDPEAAINQSNLCYKTHRVIEECSEIITAVEITPGDVNEAHRLENLLNAHTKNTEIEAETVVADSKYGTISNYLLCSDKNVEAHIPDLKKKIETKRTRNSNPLTIFSDKLFKYDAESDTYICPGNKRLKPKSYNVSRDSIDYAASKKDCSTCELKSLCTRNKNGRTIKRHSKQPIINQMRKRAESQRAKQDIRQRKHLMERTFANAKRYGFDRARWRGLSRVSIQEFLTCCVQNIQKLIKEKPRPIKSPALISEKKKPEFDWLNTQITHSNYGIHLDRAKFGLSHLL